MSYKMKSRLYTLLMNIFILLVIIIFVIIGKKQPEGEYITKDEMMVLTELVDTVLTDSSGSDTQLSGEVLLQREAVAELQELVSGWDVEEYVTYRQFLQWEGIASKAWDVLDKEGRKDLSKMYAKASFITKQDWFSYFEKLCDVIAPEGKITTEELFVLGDSTNVVDVEGNPIEESKVFTQNGRWEKKLPSEFIPMQQKAYYITYQGGLWGVYNVEEAAALFNVWIVDNTEEELVYFYKNYKVTTVKDEIIESLDREQVADLQFVLGRLSHVVVKTEKITGKVLKMSSNLEHPKSTSSI